MAIVGPSGCSGPDGRAQAGRILGQRAAEQLGLHHQHALSDGAKRKRAACAQAAANTASLLCELAA